MPNETEQPTDKPDGRLRLTGDRPKEHLVDDRLGYAKFARSLARSIADLVPPEGIVLAVNGPWGTGKTTAVNMIVDALEERPPGDAVGSNIIPIRFNPWWFSEQEDLVKAFFAELSGSLDHKLSEKVGEGFRNVARRIASSRDLVVAGLEFVPGGTLFKGAAGAALDTVGKFAGNDKSLSQLRDELAADLRAQEKRLLVIIDDVDRLPANEVRQIFRLVKSVADLPNVIYLLIFDREVAERAFEDPAGDLGPKWHEKIVQAAFDLPPVQRIDIHRLFFEGLDKLSGVELADQTRWGNVFHDAIAPWLRTPRDAGRLLNALAVTWPAVACNVDFADFVALETLRLFEPSLHAFIRHNPHRLTGLGSDRGYGNDAGESLSNEILNTVDSAGRERAKMALQRLFPRLERLWTNHGYTTGFLPQWDRGRRVCVEKRFPAYFSFGIGADVLSREELEDFAANIADVGFVRAKVTEYADALRPTGGTKAAVLLEELAANVDIVAAADIGKAVASLLDVADQFTRPSDEHGGGFLSIPAIWRFWFLIKPLLGRLQLPERAAALRIAFAQSASLRGLTFAMDVFRTSLGRNPDARPDAAGAPLIDEAACDELEEALRARLRTAAADGTLLGDSGLISSLHGWMRLGGEAEVKAWTDHVLYDDAAILRLAKAATQITRSHSEGDRVVRERPAVDKVGFEKLVDVNRMIARLDAIAGSNPGDDALRVIRDFKLGLKGLWPFASDEGEESGAAGTEP